MSTWNVRTLVSLDVEAESEEEALRLAERAIVVEEPALRRNPPLGDSPRASLLLTSRIRLDKLAEEIGESVERLLHTVNACHIPIYGRSNVDGMQILAQEQADQLRSIYWHHHNSPTQVPRPTPEHLREEYTPYERDDMRREHDARFGPDRGDLP